MTLTTSNAERIEFGEKVLDKINEAIEQYDPNDPNDKKRAEGLEEAADIVTAMIDRFR